MKVKAYAKINLTLDILCKRSDGYHDLSSVMQSISLCDNIEIKLNDTGKINIICDKDGIPTDSLNTMYKAAEKVLAAYSVVDTGADISLNKCIPSEAGLGGGSADAAAVIIALDKLLGGSLSDNELISLSAKVGADVPFCLHGGTALCEGIGEKLSSLKPLPDCYILVAKPDIGVSTKEAYASVDRNSSSFGSRNTPEMCAALEKSDLKNLCAFVGNLFDDALNIPQVQKIKERMLQCGAEAASMSGSGSAVFGIFMNEKDACDCLEILKTQNSVFLAAPVGRY